MKPRIFICNTEHFLVVPQKGTAYLMDSYDNEFIKCVGKEECQKLIGRHPEREISFIKTPRLPTIPLWYHIPLLNGRSNSTKFNVPPFNRDGTSTTWFGLKRAELDFFVRSNNGYLEFLAFLVSPVPSTFSALKGTFRQKIIEVKVIGVAKELTVNTCCSPGENEDFEFVLDNSNCFDCVRGDEIAAYFASRKELLKALKEAFGREVTKEEEIFLEKDNIYRDLREDSLYYRPDIWEA
jgi:hypothetical protein